MHIVYKTTNLINGKFYVGYHQTKKLKDDYLGSGIILSRSVRKYGKENFIRETLFEFETREEAYAKEKEIVEIYLNKDPLCMNIRPGGNGNRVTETGALRISKANTGRSMSEENKQKVSSFHKGKKLSKEHIERLREVNTGRKFSEETKAKIGLKSKGRIFTEETRKKISESGKGRIFTEETRKKISRSNKGKVRLEDQKIHLYGPRSEEIRARMSKSAIARAQKKVRCQKCNREISVYNFQRHFLSCNKKGEE